MTKSILRLHKISPALRRISPEGQNIIDSPISKIPENRTDFVSTVPNTGQVGHTLESDFVLDSPDKINGFCASASSRSIGHGDEGRVPPFQLIDRLKKFVKSIVIFWGEELERKSRTNPLQNFTNFHKSNTNIGNCVYEI
jgi:hypothetical protein